MKWPRLVAGRPLAQNHYEMVADRTLGFRLHERIKLGKEIYTIVGITSGMVSTNGEGMAFLSVWDSQAVQFDTPGEAIRLERAARERRSEANDIFLSQPLWRPRFPPGPTCRFSQRPARRISCCRGW